MAQSSGGTAKRRGPGRPFEKGDPRINRGGRRPHLLTAALDSGLTPERAKKLMAIVLKKAEEGEPWALQMVWDRHEGKAIARNESGDPGAFTGLEDTPTPDLLKFVEKDSA